MGAPTSLGELVLGIYNYSLEIVGLCVFVMFLYAGYLLMFNESKKAYGVMKDAAIGVILLFSAYVILNSINRDLVEFQDPLAPISPSGGSSAGSGGFEPGGGGFGGGGASGTY